MIWEHHRRAVENWVNHCKENPEFLAVIFAGSLTKGYGLESSDVDGWIVVTDSEYARRKATGTLHWFNRDLVDYEGGYIDAKCVPLSFLHEVDRHGSEPARSAFQGAEVPWSRIEGLSELCAKILRYPEEELEDRQRRFVSQLRFAQWFTGEAAKRGNRYLCSTPQPSWCFSRPGFFFQRIVSSTPITSGCFVRYKTLLSSRPERWS